jgi:hypothetical protein
MAFSSSARSVSAPAAGTVLGATFGCNPWALAAVAALAHIQMNAGANFTIDLFVLWFMVNPLLETSRNKK